MNLLYWVEAEDSWMRGQGFYEWHCYCDQQVRVVWHSTCDLYDSDEPIDAVGALAAHWRVECMNGHVLLLAHEVDEDQSADTYDPPTTSTIVNRLASPEDVDAWRAYEPPKPPWKKAS